MKKIKEKKLVIALIALLVVCLCVILFVVIKYFVGSPKSKYGDRLDGIKEVEIKEKKLNEIEEKIKENTLVNTISIRVKGRIIYLNYTFLEKATLVEAQSVAISGLENFSAEEIAYYDFQMSLSKEATETTEGFALMGSRNVASGKVNWNNNTKVEEDD